MGRAFVAILWFLVMVGYNGYVLVSSLWNHQMPSLVQSLTAVITALVMYIIASHRD